MPTVSTRANAKKNAASQGAKQAAAMSNDGSKPSAVTKVDLRKSPPTPLLPSLPTSPKADVKETSSLSLSKPAVEENKDDAAANKPEALPTATAATISNTTETAIQRGTSATPKSTSSDDEEDIEPEGSQLEERAFQGDDGDDDESEDDSPNDPPHEDLEQEDEDVEDDDPDDVLFYEAEEQDEEIEDLNITGENLAIHNKFLEFTRDMRLTTTTAPIMIKTDRSDLGFGYPTETDALVQTEVHLLGHTGAHFRTNEPSDAVIEAQATVLKELLPSRGKNLKVALHRAFSALNVHHGRDFVKTFGKSFSSVTRLHFLLEPLMQGYVPIPGEETVNPIMSRILYVFALIRLGVPGYQFMGDEWDHACEAVRRVTFHAIVQTPSTPLKGYMAATVNLFRVHLTHRKFPPLIARPDDDTQEFADMRAANTTVVTATNKVPNATDELTSFGVETRKPVKKLLIQAAIHYEANHEEWFKDEIASVGSSKRKSKGKSKSGVKSLFPIANFTAAYNHKLASSPNKKRRSTGSPNPASAKKRRSLA